MQSDNHPTHSLLLFINFSELIHFSFDKIEIKKYFAGISKITHKAIGQFRNNKPIIPPKNCKTDVNVIAAILSVNNDMLEISLVIIFSISVPFIFSKYEIFNFPNLK